jgi:hypothetical protein
MRLLCAAASGVAKQHRGCRRRATAGGHGGGFLYRKGKGRNGLPCPGPSASLSPRPQPCKPLAGREGPQPLGAAASRAARAARTPKHVGK